LKALAAVSFWPRKCSCEDGHRANKNAALGRKLLSAAVTRPQSASRARSNKNKHKKHAATKINTKSTQQQK